MKKEKNEELQKILEDPANLIERSIRKITFVREFFTHSVPDDERWTKNARAGFHHILVDLEDDLELAFNQLLKTHQQGLLETIETARPTGEI